MPSKNSINRPKNKNTAKAKAQHSAAKSRRTQQSDIIYGKIDSKKVQQKKVRHARLASALQKDQKDIMELDDDDDKPLDKIDTRARKVARKAAETREQSPPEKEFKMQSGKGTTLGGPPS